MALNNAPLAVASAIVSILALGAGLSGRAGLLGMSGVALIVLLAAMGLRAPGRPSWLALGTLGAWGVVFCSLLALGYRLHDPAGPLVTIGGFPAGTAMLVYGTTPLGLVLGVLYAVAFDRHILPLDKQRDFLRRFRSE